MTTAFIGLSFHFTHTKSTQFLVEVLKEFYGEVDVAANEDSWGLLPQKKRWDLVVFLQHFPKRWELESFRAGAVVLVPMYDNCPQDREFWNNYLDCKVLCFSSTLAGLLKGWGHDVWTVKYFPPVPDRVVSWAGATRSAFFWPRRPELNWTHIRPLLNADAISSVHLHLTEPTVVPTEAERAQWSMTTSSWFASPAEFAQCLERHQVYFAARRYEGIGMSFLEAMGLGMAVVSPDNPTMNEYITSGVDGYLYDPDSPVPPDWALAEAWGKAARHTSIEGRKAWLASLPDLKAWLSLGRAPVQQRLPLRRWGAIVFHRLRRIKRWLAQRARPQ